jgi:pimeloyl-ACP methyl ester carboxylesterase
MTSGATTPVTYSSIDIGGLKIAYREAGTPGKPKMVLLHGFPSSSHQYRDLIRALSDRFHIVAPDYPGFGNSDTPGDYAYTFDNLAAVMEKFLAAKGFDRYGLYVQDYGGPVGLRIVARRPEVLEWLVVQNSNAYEVGFTAVWDGLRGALWKNRSRETEKPLEGFLTLDTIKAIYLQVAKRPELNRPDNWES